MFLFSWTCDNEVDCGVTAKGPDNSDEDPLHCKTGLACAQSQFMCKDNLSCLNLSKFCDGKIDCEDNSDEGPFCKLKAACKKSSCSHECALTWRGPKCYCPPGKEPSPEGPNHCVDADECKVPGNCDQTCHNSNGSYICSCVKGYALSQNKYCHALNVPPSAPPTLLFANSINIQHVHLNGSAMGKTGMLETHETLAMDFDHRNGTLCWISHSITEQEEETTKATSSQILCAFVKDMRKTWVLPQPDIYSFVSVNQIAIDWISSNFYLLDDTRDMILLCALKSDVPLQVDRLQSDLQASRHRPRP